MSTNYLQNLGVKLARRRYFTAADNGNSEKVAVVNEAFVRRFFKIGEEPLREFKPKPNTTAWLRAIDSLSANVSGMQPAFGGNPTCRKATLSYTRPTFIEPSRRRRGTVR